MNEIEERIQKLRLLIPALTETELKVIESMMAVIYQSGKIAGMESAYNGFINTIKR